MLWSDLLLLCSMLRSGSIEPCAAQETGASITVASAWTVFFRQGYTPYICSMNNHDLYTHTKTAVSKAPDAAYDAPPAPSIGVCCNNPRTHAPSGICTFVSSQWHNVSLLCVQAVRNGLQHTVCALPCMLCCALQMLCEPLCPGCSWTMCSC